MRLHEDPIQKARDHGWQAGYHMILTDNFEWDDAAFKSSCKHISKQEDEAYDLSKLRCLVVNR